MAENDPGRSLGSELNATRDYNSNYHNYITTLVKRLCMVHIIVYII